jgi:predicted TIM-barrel fold metal-dependent hydrolase
MARVIDRISDEQLTAWRPPTFLPEPEPREVWCPIISVDDHVLEPMTMYVDHGLPSMADALPQAEFDRDGVPYWVVDGKRTPIVFSNGQSGRFTDDTADSYMPQKHTDFRQGVWDIDARLADMDLNGIHASLCFPSMVWGFCGSAFMRMQDRDAGLESVRAYNRWMMDDWCAKAPDRFIPCQMPWLADPVQAGEEIRANAARGYKAVTFSENPQGLGLPSIYSEHWDPFLRACEETGTVINLHVGSSGAIQCPSEESPGDVMVALFPVNSILAGIDWVFAQVPLRFPEIKVVLSEGGASWVPMAIERLKRATRRRRAVDDPWVAAGIDADEAFLRNFWFASIEDPAAFQLLDVIGEDRIMVESDYPHGDSTWPDTQAMLRSETEGVIPAETIRKVAYGNAAALYDHPLPPADVLARSVVGAA